MASQKKRQRVQSHTLSDSDSEPEGSHPSTRTETISHFNRTHGKLDRIDSRIEVPQSPKRAGPQNAALPTTSSSMDSPSTLGRTPPHPLKPGTQEGDQSDSVADAAAWLDLLNINHSEPWNTTASEKARRESEKKGAEGGASAKDGDGKKKRKRTTSDNPLFQFMDMTDVFLDEMLRREGLGDSLDDFKCLQCRKGLGAEGEGNRAVRCRDCCPGNLWCEECVVRVHKRMYLHRTEVWNGTYFERITLKSLGLRIQLGHPEGEECKRKLAAFDDTFLVIDSDGCHPVGVDFCECQAADPVEQLLREGLFPATTSDPKTAATFRVLETFQMLSFTSKISAYEFLVAIWRRTDNTWNVVQKKATQQEKQPDGGRVPFHERHTEWMRMIHQWRFMRMLKRFARAYYQNGIAETKEGDLAVNCPACPRPGINMPKWENIPRAKRWLYALFLAIDANFRLRRKLVSSDERDPGLIQGWAYIVAELAYKRFLETNGARDDTIEETTCSNYDAIKSANIRGGPGVAASGLGAVLCARHAFHRPSSAGDLQKGERYKNMDYIFLKGLQPPLPRKIVISYDIGCQWERHFQARCNSYEYNVLQGDHGYELTVLVPKFHLPAHQGPCVITHSFNLEPGVGRTDGEAPERGWSSSNRLAGSTMEMGPGNRRDTVDDAYGDENWEGTVEMPHTLAERATTAGPKRDQHAQAFREFAGGLTSQQRSEFTMMAKDFERDKTKANPYQNEMSVLHPKDIKAKLGKEDNDAVKEKETGIVHKGMTLSSFILHGIEIQEAQRRHEGQVKGMSTGAGMAERAKGVEQGVALRARVNGWITVQVNFAPGTVAVRQSLSEALNTNDASEIPAWSIPLCLPSDPGANEHYTHRARRYEFKYRIAQAETSLQDLRNALIYEAHMRRSKEKYSSGTEQTTRSVQVLKDMLARVNLEVERYQHVRRRLVLLWEHIKDAEDVEEHGGWWDILQILEDNHITGPTWLDDERIGEGGKMLSWIWTVPGTGSNSKQVALAALRVEFCRARARAHRWHEECLLLAEEMRRTERHFLYEVSLWEGRARDQAVTLTTTIDPSLPSKQKKEISERRMITAGKVAYAWRQAAVRRLLHQKAVEVHGERFRWAMDGVLGSGVFNSDGETWKFHRTMARPFFSKDRTADLERFDKHVQKAISLFEQRMKKGYAIDFQDLVHRITLDMFSEFLFGNTMNSLEILEEDLPKPFTHPDHLKSLAAASSSKYPASAFADAFVNAQLVVAARERVGWIWPLFELFEDKAKPFMETVNAFIDPIVNEAVKNAEMTRLSEGNVEKKEVGEDESFLEHLASQTSDKKVLKDQALNVLIAGRDTVAATLAFVFCLLSKHPEIQSRLRTEILGRVGPSKRPTYEEIKEMRYLRAVINETLRILPPVPWDVRKCVNGAVWPSADPNEKPVYLPPDASVPYGLLMMHTDEKLWGPDASEFDPDRFIDERKKRLLANPFMFLPFNGGPRICLGQQLAYNQLSLSIIRFMQAFSSFTMDGDAFPPEGKVPEDWASHTGKGRKGKEAFRPKVVLTMSCQGGMWLKAEPV